MGQKLSEILHVVVGQADGLFSTSGEYPDGMRSLNHESRQASVVYQAIKGRPENMGISIMALGNQQSHKS